MAGNVLLPQKRTILLYMYPSIFDIYIYYALEALRQKFSQENFLSYTSNHFALLLLHNDFLAHITDNNFPPFLHLPTFLHCKVTIEEYSILYSSHNSLLLFPMNLLLYFFLVRITIYCCTNPTTLG